MRFGKGKEGYGGCTIRHREHDAGGCNGCGDPGMQGPNHRQQGDPKDRTLRLRHPFPTGQDKRQAEAGG
jgi:hypothetical protein